MCTSNKLFFTSSSAVNNMYMYAYVATSSSSHYTVHEASHVPGMYLRFFIFDWIHFHLKNFTSYM